MTGAGVSNVKAGIGGAVPNIINPGIISFTQITGVAARRLGYCIGFIIIVAAFLSKVSGLIASIPAPVMAGYLMLVCGTLLVDGARLVIQNEPNRQKVTAAGICFWVGASFHFNLFFLPDFGPVWDTLFKSAITTDGLAAVLMICTWSSSAAATRPISRTASASSSSTTLRNRWSRNSRSACCGASPSRCAASSITTPTLS